MPGGFAIDPIDPLWIIAVASIVQIFTLWALVRAVGRQVRISEEVSKVVSSTELRLVRLYALKAGTTQLWEIENIGPNVAYDVEVHVLRNDAGRRERWRQAMGPAYIDGRSTAIYEVAGYLGDSALIQVRWTTLNGYSMEKTFSWVRDETGEEQVAVVQR